MIQVAICEDSVLDLEHLHSMLKNCEPSLEITKYSDAENLLWDIETNKTHFDIYFIDIYLKEISGTQLARSIRVLDEEAILIFVSISADFYKEAFDVYAFNYLIKPVEQTTLNGLMRKAINNIQKQQENILKITSHGHAVILQYEQIEYISSSNRILYFHLKGGIIQECYGRLDEIANQLRTSIFVRCHQSYVVNLQYVLEYVSEGFRIGNTLIPISRSYSESAQKAINQYLFGIFENS